MQYQLPICIMRGGTSRGLFFLEDHLPKTPRDRDQILLKIIGAGERRGVNGIGSEDPLLNKIAIISKSSQPGCDVDYLFIQGNCEKKILDTSGNCGNIASAVGQFGLESGLINYSPTDTYANIKIFNLNTKKFADSLFPIKNGLPVYEGDKLIDGVHGSSAPVVLNFYSPEGAVTSSLFPTGNKRESINGITCSVIDCATLVIIIMAKDLNLTGKESPQELNARPNILEKITDIRQVVCTQLGLPSADKSMLPKVCIISPPTNHANISARFYTPFTCHAASPLTGAIALAAASKNHETIFSMLNDKHTDEQTHFFKIEHPSGMLDVSVALKEEGDNIIIEKAGFVRTARKIMTGSAYY